jgi:hypothetical protein
MEKKFKKKCLYIHDPGPIRIRQNFSTRLYRGLFSEWLLGKAATVS